MTRSPALRRLAAALAVAAVLVMLPGAAAAAPPLKAPALDQSLTPPGLLGWLWQTLTSLLGEESPRATGPGQSPRLGSAETKAGGEMNPDGQPQTAPPTAPQAGGGTGSAG